MVQLRERKCQVNYAEESLNKLGTRDGNAVLKRKLESMAASKAAKACAYKNGLRLESSLLDDIEDSDEVAEDSQDSEKVAEHFDLKEVEEEEEELAVDSLGKKRRSARLELSGKRTNALSVSILKYTKRDVSNVADPPSEKEAGKKKSMPARSGRQNSSHGKCTDGDGKLERVRRAMPARRSKVVNYREEGGSESSGGGSPCMRKLYEFNHAHNGDAGRTEHVGFDYVEKLQKANHPHIRSELPDLARFEFIGHLEHGESRADGVNTGEVRVVYQRNAGRNRLRNLGIVKDCLKEPQQFSACSRDAKVVKLSQKEGSDLSGCDSLEASDELEASDPSSSEKNEKRGSRQVKKRKSVSQPDRTSNRLGRKRKSLKGVSSEETVELLAEAPARTRQKNVMESEVIEETDNEGDNTEEDEGENTGPFIARTIGRVEKILTMKTDPKSGLLFLVKFEGLSYREAAWVKEKTLLSNQAQLLQNFKKRSCELEDHIKTHDEAAFPAEFTIVERVVADEGEGKRKQYLVKWQGLPYSDSTWELAEDLKLEEDCKAIERFHYFNSRSKSRNKEDEAREVTFKDGRKLRGYQQQGVQWIYRNFNKFINSILADEMGLGKTLQSVAVLETLRMRRGIQGPFLIIAPVTTLGHWQREVESLDNINCVVYMGTQTDRDIIREHEFWYAGGRLDIKFNVLLTSFEILQKDKAQLAKLRWQYCIVDEAHRLKTTVAKTTLALKELDIRKGGLLLLTGTPVQNNTRELFGLLNVLDPENFGSEHDFMEKFGDIKDAAQVTDLQENVLRPRLLRRMKDDVEKSIPKKDEVIIWVELTQEQRLYYRAILENKVSILLKGSKGNNLPNLRNIAMELRKLCNHPFLCDGLLEDMLHKKQAEAQKKLIPADTDRLEKQLLRQSSGKMVLIDKLLPKLKEAGHRVLIFSQFVIMLDLLEDYLLEEGYSYERIDGNIRGSERQAAIDRYSAKDSDTFIFLLSTKAGGLGITLTAADTCIIYDSDWNPQNDLQAMARCHRIGQTKDVKIYRLITHNTYEEMLFQSASRKYGLDEAILGKRMGADRGPEQGKDIESLLKNGAYDILKEEGAEEAAAFSAASIDQILQQRTQTRAIGGSGNSTFSVATFAADEGENVEGSAKDGADFWQELLPDACRLAAETPSDDPFTVSGRRRRTKINYTEKNGAASDVEEWVGEDEDGMEVPQGHRNKNRNGKRKMAEADELKETEGMEQWSEAEVKRLEEKLFLFGPRRTDEVRKEAALQHRGMEEVEEVSQNLIRLCEELADKVRCKEASECPSLPHGSVVDGNTFGLKTPFPTVKPAMFRAADSDVPPHEDLCDTKGGSLAKGRLNDRAASCEAQEKPREYDGPACARKVLQSNRFQERLQRSSVRYLQLLHERRVLADVVARGFSEEIHTRLWNQSPWALPSWTTTATFSSACTSMATEASIK